MLPRPVVGTGQRPLTLHALDERTIGDAVEQSPHVLIKFAMNGRPVLMCKASGQLSGNGEAKLLQHAKRPIQGGPEMAHEMIHLYLGSRSRLAPTSSRCSRCRPSPAKWPLHDSAVAGGESVTALGYLRSLIRQDSWAGLLRDRCQAAVAIQRLESCR